MSVDGCNDTATIGLACISRCWVGFVPNTIPPIICNNLSSNLTMFIFAFKKETDKTEYFQLANHIHFCSFLSNTIQWKPEIPCKS